MANNAKIEDLVAPILESHGAFLVDFLLRGERGGKVLEFFIDTDQGISADKCGQISREMAPVLEASGLIPGSYNLVVSSPGLDRPLKLLPQYRRNVGRKISVVFKDAETENKIEGELIEVHQDYINVRPEKGDVKQIPVKGIVRTVVIPRW